MSNRVIEAVLRLSSKLGSMAAFSQLSQNLDRVDSKARRFNRAQGMIADGGRNMHATLLRYAAPAALTYGAKQAYVDFAELERRMTRIGITADATASESSEAFKVLQRQARDFAMPLDDVIVGLDTLVSSGLTLQDAMSFLPAILRTAQASGSATEDIANTAQKSASALKITAGEMQSAFDIMVEGGKAGQFELKDMATYVPELANSFASLGYEGQEGLKALVAILQTIREDTGSAGAAATQAQNIFGKMYTEETAKKFSKMGVDIRKEMAAAKVAGEGAVEAFVRISRQTINGDLTKLPLLFTDQEFRLGMQSLMTSADSWSAFVAAVNSDRVDGSVLRDFNRVLDDNQAKIDRMSNSWSKLKTTIGAASAPAISAGLEHVSEGVSKADAINSQLEKEGYSFLGRRGWWAQNGFNISEQDDKAWAGGYRTDEERRQIEAYSVYGKSRAESSPTPMVEKDDKGMPVAGIIPTTRPTSEPDTDDFETSFRRQVTTAKGNRGFAPDASPRDAERSSMVALRDQQGDIADALNDALTRVAEAPRQRDEGPTKFERFLFGDAADGKSFREAMRIDAGIGGEARQVAAKDVPPAPRVVELPERPTKAENVSSDRDFAKQVPVPPRVIELPEQPAKPENGSSDRDFAKQVPVPPRVVELPERPAKAENVSSDGDFAKQVPVPPRAIELPERPATRENGASDNVAQQDVRPVRVIPLPDRQPVQASMAETSGSFGDIGKPIDEAAEAVADGGRKAGESIADAARRINEAGTSGGQAFGNEAGSTFSRMLDGMADQFGARAAASLRANLGAITVQTRATASPQGEVSGVRGRTMPNAGSTPGN
ncbi:phage tail tape measure protein [Mesorhizobium sp. CAU 1732]|uniref:phage tail tape measure protein n=1 Tax=Mesorhizobium sp. CAU 1732 TaxID=3140358 RepID=UPI0032600A47